MRILIRLRAAVAALTRRERPRRRAPASDEESSSSREASPVPPEEEEETDGRISLAAASRNRKASLIQEASNLLPATAQDVDGDMEMDAAPGLDAADAEATREPDVDVDGEEHELGAHEDEEGAEGDEEDLEHEMEESDLQPAHRAEALDVLASIELKFALLRERVYVEKMESLAVEEELVNEGVCFSPGVNGVLMGFRLAS